MAQGWHRAKFSCRECSYSCDIHQDMEYEDEHKDWQWDCLTPSGVKPVWKRTWIGKASFK